MLAGGALVAVLLCILVVVYRRRRGGTVDLLRKIGVELMQDTLLPDAMGGQIHLRHVLLTAKGILVLDIKTFGGRVFASDRMDEWTLISGTQRFTFPNPQPALYDRVAAIKAVVRDVPVTGHILFLEGAEFTKGSPKGVIFPDELLNRYAKPEAVELERLIEAFHPHWEKVQQASVPAPRAPNRV